MAVFDILTNHSPTKKRSFSFRKLNSTFFHKFSAANYDSVLSFFPARQVFEIIFNESSKSIENALIESLQKDKTKYLLKSKVYVFGNKCSFQNWFWNLSSTSSLSQI
jgi:hypothetical protein